MEAKKVFSRVGLAAFTALAAGTLGQFGIARLLPEFAAGEWGFWLCTMLPLYLIGMPLGALILRKLPAKPVEKQKLPAKQTVILVFIGFFMMYAGNYIGNAINSAIGMIFDRTVLNPVDIATGMGSIWPRILFMVILGPVLEELVFRKYLLDRLRIYGERWAIIGAAVVFGLFHGNFFQLFYAVGLGFVMGYLYMRTGKIRLSAALHILINFLGGVVGPGILSHLDLALLDNLGAPESFAALLPMLPWLIGLFCHAALLLGAAVAGLVLLCIYHKKAVYLPAEQELPARGWFRSLFVNVGMILLAVLSISMTALLMV